MRWRHVSIAGAAALLATLAALVALVDPHVGRHASHYQLALDRSSSIDAGMRQVESAWLDAVSARTCAAPCRVVTFAGQAQALPPTAQDLAAGAPLPEGPGETDLQRGVQAAIAAAPTGGRVIVLSDGQQTEGDLTGAVAAARARKVTVDAVALDDPAPLDAALTRLDAPRSVHQGDTIPLLVTVHSTAISFATLSVSHDGGKPVTQQVRLAKGDNPFTLSYTAARTGWHSFRVRIGLPHDQRAQNDELSASVDVGAAPKVIVASTTSSPAILPALRARGLQPVVELPAALPGSAAGYAPIDAVVLEDVPAKSLTTAQVAALGSAVRDSGLGLLTLGGPHAYSLGGYAHSPLNQILPVSSLVPGDLQRRNLALQLVLDRSGSMNDKAGGVRKITMAQSAARQTAQFVSTHRDELGIVDFDITPHVLLTMRRVMPGADAKRVQARVDTLRASGGTDIYLGLQAGYRQLLASTSTNRHLILMSDGISQPHNYQGLLQLIVQHHITVSTVALGTNVDAKLLRSIATAAGGNFYQTSNAHDLPRIFVKETRLSAKPVQVSGTQRVLPQGSSPVVRSLAGRTLPDITGNVVTHLRTGAQVGLIARSGTKTTDPALAQWGYGTGRVVSWTPGLGAPWATAWTAETGLWNDAVRWVDRSVPSSPARVTARTGSTTRIDADLSSTAPTPATSITATLELTGGRTRRLVLGESAPSVYSTSTAALAPGSYGLTLDLPASLGGQQRVLVDVPYAAEYLPTPVGGSALGQLAAQTGGVLLPADHPGVFAGDRRSLREPLLIVALVLFLVSVALRLLRRARPRPPSPTRPRRPAARQREALTRR
jgi:Ca-activated chloride channel family protein